MCLFITKNTILVYLKLFMLLPKDFKMKQQQLFDHLKNLTSLKTEWNPDPVFSAKYSQYMINRFIGMNDMFLPIITEINQLKDLPDDVHYNLLLNYLPKRNLYFKYISRNAKDCDPEKIEMIQDHFECSISVAEDYYEFIPQIQLEELYSRYASGVIRKKK